ncbi:hypothetical protein L198_06981 [Cryptococcus wingfieldii CBS 7118]|uniref:Zn(2)-C6 fungal-type domain-containing protein n=1 Tax=Cryptococcus wingfieldii CBS 7118 TaxID=1295528 RepID=A0A1E3IJ69_9TREE|nr:hypothetical protein L198_06981 [Cryptococcus wingfieldii CBS 7118]ODN87751.1 hypothetical protein L198_06981 [Cryptococcus wingfieldii CBS 7118]
MTEQHGDDVPPPSAPRQPETGRKRTRQVLVCMRCKSLKLKCDLEKPCASCKRANLKDGCVYKPWPSEDDIRPAKRKSRARRGSLSAHSSEHRAELHSPLGDRMEQLENTVADLVSQLHSQHSPRPALAPPAPSETQWRHLLDMLPPRDICEDLLDRFELFDIMFRSTHMPSFRRRATCILPGALSIGVRCPPSRSAVDLASPTIFPSHLDDLYRRLVSFTENKSDTKHITLDYVHALSLEGWRSMYDNDMTVAQSWILSGKVANAALFLKLDRDPSELGQAMETFEAEMRRRLWWQVVISDTFVTKYLDIPKSMISLIATSTRMPAAIPDISLEPPNPSLESGIPEWSYINSKIAFTSVLARLGEIKQSHGTVLPREDLRQCISIIDTYEQNLEPHLRANRGAVRLEPPWVYAQACVVSMGSCNTVIQLCQQAMATRLPDDRAFALSLAVERSRSLVTTARAYVDHRLFRWPDCPPLNLWTFGSKVFNAGIMLACSLLSSPRDPGFNLDPDQRLELVDMAIGALAFSIQENQGETLNERALKTLRTWRSKVANGGQELGSGEGLLNPYTGQGVSILEGKTGAVAVEDVWKSFSWDLQYLELFDWSTWLASMMTDACSTTGD